MNNQYIASGEAKEKFLNGYLDLCKVDGDSTYWKARKLIITPTYACYDGLSSVVIELEGTGPKLTMFVFGFDHGLPREDFNWTIIAQIGTQKYNQLPCLGKKQEVLIPLLTDLLKSVGIVE